MPQEVMVRAGERNLTVPEMGCGLDERCYVGVHDKKQGRVFQCHNDDKLVLLGIREIAGQIENTPGC